MNLYRWLKRGWTVPPARLATGQSGILGENETRAARITPLVDADYYRGRYGLANDVDPFRHYLEEGGLAGLDPSPLFEAAFYLAQLDPKGLPSGTTPLEHYLAVGAEAGHDPSPLLETRFYLAANPDVVAAGVNPLLHFMQSGAEQGRRPVPAEKLSLDAWVDALLARHPGSRYALHLRSALERQSRAARIAPLLNTDYYRIRYHLASDVDPFRHYLDEGGPAGLDPSPLFDSGFYLAQLGPEKLPADVTPLEHYLSKGADAGHNPSPLFDTRFYLTANPDVAAARVNPLLHFLESGAQQGRPPVPPERLSLGGWVDALLARDPASGYALHLRSALRLQARAVCIAPLVDVDYYRGRYELANDVDPFRHYLQEGGPAGLDPSPLFDAAFYLAQLGPEILLAGTTPLEHYLSLGADTGHDPSPLFSTRFYLAANPDVAAAGVNPLLHFVQNGAREGRPPVPPERLSLEAWVDALLERHPVNGHGLQLRSALQLQARAVRLAPLVDVEYYRGRYGLSRDVDPFRHYLEEGGTAGLDPSPLFDTAFYLAQLGPEKVPADMTPLEHYLRFGSQTGYDPSPLFSTRHYLAENPDVAAANSNPLLHFLQNGASEGRVGLPLSLPDLEARVERALRDARWSFLVVELVVGLRLKQGRVSDALALIERAKETDGLENNALKGRVLQTLGRLPEAISAYENTAVRGASRDEVDQVVAQRLVQAGYALEVANEIKLAIDSYEAAIARRPPEERHLRDHLKTLKHVYVEHLYAQGEREPAVSLARTTMWDRSGSITERRLLSVRERCEMAGDPYRELRPLRPIPAPDLRFLGAAPNLSAERGSLCANAVYSATLSDCIAFGRCNILLAGDSAVYDLARQPRAAEAVLNDRALGKPLIRARAADSLLLELPPLPTVSVERGLSMFGVQSGNYGHWFLEYLPKMLVFDEHAPTNMPIYVDHGMPETHLQSLQLLNTSDRPIMYLPSDSMVRFELLGVAPVPAYFPLDLKRNAFYDTVWPSDVFSDLRAKLTASLERTGRISSGPKRRLFISRKAFASRQLVNETEIANALASLGFVTVFPEKLTFDEQVNVFRNASAVVGSCSSALTNCIFCDPDCPVIGLIHDEPSFNYYGYASFLSAGGVKILFVQGTSLKESGTHPLHARFAVSPEQVIRALRMEGVG